MACRKFDQERPLLQRLTPSQGGLPHCETQSRKMAGSTVMPVFIGFF
jgi:hypothetical protein